MRRKDIIYNILLVVIDHFTKISKYLPKFKEYNTEELANLILNYIICRYKIPDNIINNRGTIFINNFWSVLYFYTKIKCRLNTAYHP